MLTIPKIEISLKRKAVVVIQLKRPGFVISTAGQTEQSGRTGDIIKVKNLDSKRIIHCKIMSDGTVEPIL